MKKVLKMQEVPTRFLHFFTFDNIMNINIRSHNEVNYEQYIKKRI